MKPVIYKPLQQALFDAAAESLNEYVQRRDIDGACDPDIDDACDPADTLRARAKFYALMGVIEESGKSYAFAEYLSSARKEG